MEYLLYNVLVIALIGVVIVALLRAVGMRDPWEKVVMIICAVAIILAFARFALL